MRLISEKKRQETICGYYCAACIMADLSFEDTRRGLMALEELLPGYEPEDARGLYNLLMGRNPELEAYMSKVLRKEAQGCINTVGY